MSSSEEHWNARAQGVFQFDGFRVEPASRRLLSEQNEEIFLRPKAFDMLMYLLCEAHRVVSKEELLTKLWPETAVEESGIPHCIWEIREALGDRADEPRYVKTISRVGYIFIAEVTATEAKQRTGTTDTQRPASSIAVLPFRDMGPRKDLDYLCEGLAEEIINSLVHLRNVRVVARTSSFCFKDIDVDIREIGRRLNVETVLEGSLRVVGDNLRVGVQLIKTSDGFHLWSDQLDFEMSTVFLIQSQITEQIFEKLKIEIVGESAAASIRQGTDNPNAYVLNLKGRYLLYRENVEDLRKAIVYFKQAVQLAPDYAGAYAFLSTCYTLLGFWNVSPPAEAYLEAKNSAVRAVEADPESALTHEALTYVTLLSEWDWETAERASRRALELTPHSESAHTVRGVYFMAVGELEEAIAETLKAVELDPLSSLANRYLACCLTRAGKLRQGIDQFQKALELEPTSTRTRWWLGQAYMLDSRHAEGISEIKKALTDSDNNILILAGLGWAYGVADDRAKALEVVEELKKRFGAEHPRPYLVAKVYSGLGENDLAFRWLEKAFAHHETSLAFVKTDETLAALHPDPRFDNLLRRMNLGP